jgi:lysophospholipase L1-like esterase
MAIYQSKYTGKQIDDAVANQKVMAGEIYKIRNSIDSFDYGILVQKTLRYGVLQDSPDNQYKITSLIDVSAHNQIIITGGAAYYNNLYAFYDENQAYLENESLVATSETYLNMEVVEVPANAKYVRVAMMDYPNGNDTTLFVGYYTTQCKITEPKLSGKKWALFGDSLTDCTNTLAFRRYYRVLTDTATDIVNYAVSGSGYIQNNGATINNIVSKVEALTGNEGYDIISVFAGINDSGDNFGGYGLGELGDTEPSTMYGAIYTVFSTLQEKFPNSFVFAITPTVTSYRHSANNEIDQIAEAVRKVCAWLKIPVADVNKNCPLKPWIEANQQKYYETNDGVHPNQEGHKLIAKAVRTVFDFM